MEFSIRRGTLADAPALAAFAERTFAETFAADNRPEDMALHAASAYGPELQRRELDDPAVRTWLAFSGPTLAAYAQLRTGPAPAVVLGSTPVEIWRFYLARAWHGHGLAQQLMQHVLDDAAQLGADTVWLGVWERNPRAIAFYVRQGFVDVGAHAFVLGTDRQTDRLMVRAASNAAPQELRLIRRYRAPLARVWTAWADEQHIREWWGPRGFSITTRKKQLQVGGTWDYVMHGPDGTDWPNFTRYHEVVPESRLVYDHGATSADAAPMFRVTAAFRAVSDETELDLRMAFPSADAAAQARGFIKAVGGNGTWDRLAEFLERRATSREVCIVTETIPEPADAVPQRRWFANPHEVTTQFAQAAWWARTHDTRVTCVAEGPCDARVTVQVTPTRAATADEVAAFVQARDALARGWSTTMCAHELKGAT